MFSREERQRLHREFWDGLKEYQRSKGIKRRWLLNRISIPFAQLKFYVDHKKAMVLFQIDHKTQEERREVYSYFYAMRKLWEEDLGEPLIWEENYLGFGEREVSIIALSMDGVNIYRPEDHEKIYDFLIEKMIGMEAIHEEYKEVLEYQISQIE